MKHISKISKKLLILIISVAVIATGTVVFFACQPSKSNPIAPKNGHTVSMTPPSDGSLPDHYTGLENLAYMAGRLAARTYYHSENNGIVNNPVGKQTVVGTKDYYGGVLITQSISTSSFVNVAQQKFFGDGKVVVRGPKYGKDKWNGIYTEWTDKSPSAVLDTEQYAEAYGLWADEFSDYVLNEETVLEVSDLSKTAEGNYKQTYTLDPDGATYYYKRQMRTMGNLGDYPDFSAVSITFTFDDTWAVLQADIVESYHVFVSIISASCSASSTIVYSYDESEVDVSAYESYFKQYADAPATGSGERELGVVDYLQYGFAPYLEQPSTFDLAVTVGGERLSGKVTLDLANGLAIRVSFGDILIDIESDFVYIQYKDFKGKLALSDLTGLFGSGAAGVDPNALMEQLGAGTIEKDGENVSMSCSLSLGSLTVPLSFRFVENEGNDISFIGVEASISYKTLRLEASFAPSEEGEVPPAEREGAVNVKPYLESIVKLVADKSFSLSANYENEELGLSVSGEAYINASESALCGEMIVRYKGISVPVSIVYADRTAYLQVAGIKLKTTKDYLAEALEAALTEAGVSLPAADRLNEIVGALICADYGAAIRNLSLTDEALALSVDLDALLANFTEKEFGLGVASAIYDPAQKAFSLSVYGIEASLTGTAARQAGAPAEKDEYIDLSVFEQFVAPIKAIAKAKDAAFSLAVETTVGECEWKGEISGEVKFAQGLELYLKATLNGKTAEALYADGAVYLGFAGQKIKIAESDLTQFAENLSALLGKSAQAEGGREILSFFSAEGLDLQALIDSLRLAVSEGENGAALRFFADLGILNENLSELACEISAEGDHLFATSIRPVTVFGVSLSRLALSVRAAENEYDYGFAGAVDFKPYLEGIWQLIEEKSFEIRADYENAELGLAVSGKIYVNASASAASGEFTVRYASLTVPVIFTYTDDTAYLQVYGIKLKTGRDEASEAIGLALQYAGVSLPEAGAADFDLAKIVCAAVTADYTQIFKTFTITDESLALTLDLDALFAVFGQSAAGLGELSATYSPAQKAFSLSAFGIEASLTGTAARQIGAPEDKDAYLNLSLLEKFAAPVWEIAHADDIAFVLEFSANILGIDLTAALSGEVKLFENQLSELYLKAEIFVDGYADEVVEIVWSEGYVTIVYGGRAMRVAETQLTQLAEKLGGLFASSGEVAGDGFNAALLLFSDDGIDLQAVLESVRLAGSEGDGLAVLDLFANLGVIGEDFAPIGARVSTDGHKLFASLTDSTKLFGLEVKGLQACVWAAENEFAYDFSDTVACANVFEFIVNAYAELADTQYLSVDVDYVSDLLTANVCGLFEFVPAENASFTVNFDLRAEIHTFAYNEAGEKIADANHFLNMVTVGETAYISYSLYGYNASNALYVSLPVEQLFVLGNMVMPLIMPVLGISEDVYYLDLVNNLLAVPQTRFSTDLFNALRFADVLKLLDGIAAEGAKKDGEGNVNLSENLGLFSLGKNENGDIFVSLCGVSVGEGKTLSLALTAQKQGAVAADLSKSYIDISSIATLVGDVLNAYEYTDTGYELSGDLTMSVLGITLDLTVNVNLKVGVEDDGTPYANINLTTNEYKNVLVVGFFGTQCVIDGDTETDITIKDGVVYMTRHRTSYWKPGTIFGKEQAYGSFQSTDEYLYRKMTLEDFLADAMNQIFFAISLGDGAKDYIVEQVNKSSSGDSSASYDAGDMVKSYAFANDTYSLSLDMGAIANSSSLGALSLNISREQIDGKDYYDLVNLSGEMKLVSVITMKFNLTHTSCGSPVDFSVIDTNINRVNENA